jgi:hypothetical protein
MWYNISNELAEMKLMNSIEYELSQVCASMEMEDMPLTEPEKDDLRSFLSGVITFTELKRKIYQDIGVTLKNAVV